MKNPSPPRRRVLRFTFVVLCGVATAWSAARFARFVTAGEAVAYRPPSVSMPVMPDARPSLSEDVELARHRLPGLVWGPAVRTRFGPATAWYATAHDRMAPETLFATARPNERSPARSGPDSLAARVAPIPGGLSLTRLGRARAGRDGSIALDASSVVLAFQSGDAWDYLLFVFPEGLTVEAGGQSPLHLRTPRMGPVHEDLVPILEPVFIAPPEQAGVQGVLARARDGREALERAIARLQAKGWNLEPFVGEEEGAQLVRRGRTIRLSRPSRTDGLVLVQWQVKE